MQYLNLCNSFVLLLIKGFATDVLIGNWQLTVLTVYVFLYGKVYLVCVVKFFMIELQLDLFLNCSFSLIKITQLVDFLSELILAVSLDITD